MYLYKEGGKKKNPSNESTQGPLSNRGVLLEAFSN